MPPLPPSAGGDASRPRELRLFRSAEFRQVRENGKSASSELMRMIALDTGMHGESRVGIVTSRRVGGAVCRNRVRRRLREIHRNSRSAIKPGCWVVLDARKPAASVTFEELRREWLRLAKKLSILRSS